MAVEEERSKLLVNKNNRSSSTGTAGVGTMTPDHNAVRRRLGLCLFFHIVGGSIVQQVYPKVVLEHFDGDDGEASRFNGWVTFWSSMAQLIAIPSFSGASDIVGRRLVLITALAVNGAAVLALGINVNSIVACVAAQVITGVAGVVLPVSQAIIIDLARGNSAERGEVARGLGLIGAVFGLAIGVGPILGGSLAENNRRAACVLSAAISLLSVLSCRFYGWKETAPELLRPQPINSRGGGKCGAWRLVNPFSVLKVFLSSRLLVQLALSLFLFCLSLNVYTVWYNFLDFQFHWSALDISFFFSAYGVCIALTSGFLIRFLVPQRLSEEQGIVLGLSLQALSMFLYGSAPYGWVLYIVIVVTLLQFITEPCIQSVMARLVGADRQGSLQGAVMSLRVLAQGIAGPAYGQVFAFGVSQSIKKMMGTLLPGLPLFIATTLSVTACCVAWCTVGKDPESVRKVTEVLEGPAPADTLAVVEDGDGSGSSAPPVGVRRFERDSLTMETLPSHESEALVSSDALRGVMMREPLLGDSSTSGTSS